MDTSSKGKAKEMDGQQQQHDHDQAGAQESSPSSSSSSSSSSVCIITIGMAGSGKTTFIHRLTSYLYGIEKPPYILNLDPAVINLGYEANIDIRDTVSYKDVMKQYNLGPNGGILTALNLFTTKFDQVLSYVDKKTATGQIPYILCDTPGQIEIFTWSASGAIITDALAASMPTVVAYIIDTPRTSAPETFMSNMLYACSILYKTKLPFVLVFNKIDVQDCEFAKEWMDDFEAFQAALMRRKQKQRGGQQQNNSNEDDAPYEEEEGGYMTSLMSSMSLVLEEFYKNLRSCGVSAMTGEGMEDFFSRVDEAKVEYEEVYRPELKRLQEERERIKREKQGKELERAMKDMNVNVPLSSSSSGSKKTTGAGDVKGSSSAEAKKTTQELLAELEEQERLEEQEEAEIGWAEEGETIDREDHEMYSDLRKEHQRRSGGVAGSRAAAAAAATRGGSMTSMPPSSSSSGKKSVVDDDFGSRWPAP